MGGGAHSLSVLLPPSNGEVLLKQDTATGGACLCQGALGYPLVVEFIGLWVGREQARQHQCSRTPVRAGSRPSCPGMLTYTGLAPPSHAN